MLFDMKKKHPLWIKKYLELIRKQKNIFLDDKQTNKQNLAVDRYPYPPKDNQLVVPLSLDSPFHNCLSRRVEKWSKYTKKLTKMIISIQTVSCHDWFFYIFM